MAVWVVFSCDGWGVPILAKSTRTAASALAVALFVETTPAGSVGLRTWVALRRALRCGELCPK